jgi:hypothetical protein
MDAVERDAKQLTRRMNVPIMKVVTMRRKKNSSELPKL